MRLTKRLFACLVVFWVLAGGAGLAGLWFLWVGGYEGVAETLLRMAGKSHRLTEFKKLYLTPGRFTGIRYALVAVMALYGALSVVLYRRGLCWMVVSVWYLGLLAGRLRFFWHSLPVAHQRAAVVFLAVMCACKLGQAVVLPVFYDEAWTYLNFTSRFPLLAVGYYAAPNNHILYTLLTSVTAVLPLPATLALRLPNLLLMPVAFMTWLLLLRRWFAPGRALAGAVLLASSYPVQVYAVQARGYLLYMLLASLAFALVHSLAVAPGRRRRWLFVAVGALGMYTMPSFLYVLFSCAVYAMLVAVRDKRWAGLRTWFATGLWTAAVTLVLYLPVLLVSGWRAVADNPFVKRYPLAEIVSLLPGHFTQVGDWLSGGFEYGHLAVAGLLVAVGWQCLNARNAPRKPVWLCLVFLLCPFVIILLHRAVPFERTWSFCIFPMVVGLIGFSESMTRLPKRAAWVAVGLCCFLSVWIFSVQYPRQYAADYRGRQLAAGLMAHGVKKLYVQHDYDEVLLYYHFTTAGRAYQAGRGPAAPDPAIRYDCLVLASTDGIDTTRYQRMPGLPPVVFFYKPVPPK